MQITRHFRAEATKVRNYAQPSTLGEEAFLETVSTLVRREQLAPKRCLDFDRKYQKLLAVLSLAK